MIRLWTERTVDELFDSWPAHPTPTPVYYAKAGSFMRLPEPVVGGVVEWWWYWRTCKGEWVCGSDDPGDVCKQPGVCVIHDPPDAVIPW